MKNACFLAGMCYEMFSTEKYFIIFGFLGDAKMATINIFLLKFILSVRLKEKSNYIELFIWLKKALVRRGKKREHNRKIQLRTKQKQTTKQTKDRKSNKIVLSTRSSLKKEAKLESVRIERIVST